MKNMKKWIRSLITKKTSIQHLLSIDKSSVVSSSNSSLDFKSFESINPNLSIMINLEKLLKNPFYLYWSFSAVVMSSINPRHSLTSRLITFAIFKSKLLNGSFLPSFYWKFNYFPEIPFESWAIKFFKSICPVSLVNMLFFLIKGHSSGSSLKSVFFWYFSVFDSYFFSFICEKQIYGWTYFSKIVIVCTFADWGF